MSDKTKELLSVLDLPEDEQWDFLLSLQVIQRMCENQLDAYCQPKYKRRILADLAFRLMNECDKNRFMEAVLLIQTEETSYARCLQFLLEKPIKVIIAALMAKDSASS